MNTLAIRNTLKSTGAQAAEKQLATIGTNHGDDQLALIIGDLTPGEVGLFLAETDYTKPSVITPFISPNQLFGALERIASKWGSLQGAGLNALLSLTREISDHLLPVILHAEAPHQGELLKKLMENSLSRSVLVSIPLFEYESAAFFTDFSPNTGQNGTWQELYVAIYHLFPGDFEKLKGVILGLLTKDPEDGEDDMEPSTKEAEAFLKRTLQALSNRAAKLVESNPEEQPRKALFDKF